MAEAAVGCLLGKLRQILLHDVHLVQDAKAELEILENDLLCFGAFLQDSRATSRKSKVLMELVREIGKFVNKIEDGIDAYVAECADKKSMGYFRKMFHVPSKLINVTQEAKEIGKKVQDVMALYHMTGSIRMINAPAQPADAKERERQEMAEAAAEVGFLLENLKQILLHYIPLVQDHKAEVESLEIDLRFISAFLEESAETSRNSSKAMMELVREIRDRVYEIEDVIDVYVAENADKKSMDYFRKWLNAPSKLIDVADEVKNIVNKVKDVLRLEVNNPAQPAYASLDGQVQGRYSREENIVGFEDEAEKIVKFLNEEKNELDCICIIGLPGLGKTTLAGKIYHDPKIESEFRVWVYVSQEYNKKDVFLAILRQLKNTDDLQHTSDEVLAQMIHEKLKKGKFLIVMDDVWSADAWKDLKDAFPKTNKAGKILITSRNVEVAQANPSREPHRLRFLTKEESWKLLQLEAFGSEINCPQELKGFRESIVQKCEGLPLAIVVIAGILLKKYVTGDPTAMGNVWREVSESVPMYLREDRNLEKIISLSYRKLPYPLRSCFLYLGMFPEDFEIPVWTLIRMWVAEGFIQNIPKKTLEETAQDYLIDLTNRNLVMVEKVSTDGKIKSCRIHATLHQFCKTHGENGNFFKEMKSAGGGFGLSHTSLTMYRRLCIHSSIKEFISSSQLYGPRVRSFLCYSNEEKFELPAENVFSIPDAFRMLKILDARPITFTKVPGNITKLVHLRYLVLSSTLKVVPEVISELWNLETLVVYTSHRTLEIKANIWMMIQLRHVKTNASAILPNTEKSTKHLVEKLQTLGAISPQSCREDVFDRARGLRKLCIMGKLVELLEAKGFDQLDKLEKLKLVNDVSTSTSENKLPRLPRPYTLPPKVRSLTLCATRLDWHHMSTLGMLATLEVLKLKENAFMGDTWEASYGGFLHLKVLHIERTDLIVWRADNNHFPRLKYLVLRNCEKLQGIPLTLAEVESFQRLDLKRVSRAACDSAREIEKLKKLKEENGENQSTATIKTKFKLYIAPGDE